MLILSLCFWDPDSVCWRGSLQAAVGRCLVVVSVSVSHCWHCHCVYQALNQCVGRADLQDAVDRCLCADAVQVIIIIIIIIMSVFLERFSM